MKFSTTLKKATLIRRYKRFLADVILEDGTEQTIHVANTGSMTNCGTEGDTIWYSTSTNPKRKYAFSWEITETKNGHYICVNTLRANQLTEEAIIDGTLYELQGYDSLKREVKYGNENSRIDFFLTSNKKPHCYIEVKSCTLLEGKQGYFPDSVTKRGQKHLRELMKVAESGHRAILLFVILHTGINSIKIAKHIDNEYFELILQARNSGVEIIAYKADVSPNNIKLNHCEKVCL